MTHAGTFRLGESAGTHTGAAEPAVSLETVLVTGGTGFIGQHLCAWLLTRGDRVRVLRRNAHSPVPPGTTAMTGELNDRGAVREAVAGASIVVHLAARVHVMNDGELDPLAAYRRVNVDGTRLLLEEAIGAGVRRFVFFSSVKAVGEENAAPWTEDTIPAPSTPYGASKLAAEQLVRRLAEETQLHAPILRLPLVYGPGNRANMLRLFEAVDRGLPLPFGRVRNKRSLVYVGNVTAAVEAVLAAPSAARETFFVADGKPVSTAELASAIAAALGRRARLVPVPPTWFRAAGRAGDIIRRVGPCPLDSAVVQRLLSSLVVDCTKLGRLTGFEPSFSLEDGLRITAAWYRGERAGR